MAFIVETSDPFQPLKGMRKHRHEGGITIRQWLEMTYPGFIEFEKPTICIVNGDPVLRADWDTRIIGKDDIVNFVGVVGYEWVVIILVVLIVALSITLALTSKTPETPGELPASSPVFSTHGKTNAIRLGEPIECSYGRNRIFPSLASRPFYRYIGNDQFQHSLLCIGQGLYEIEDIFIGDTLIENFQEVEYEILEPGETTSLFATNVITSVEVGGQTLYATNQPEYVAPGWVGPFPANPAGTEVHRIEVDLTFPRGLYMTDKKGRILPRTCRVEVEYREIDDAGTPIGSYVSLLDDDAITRTTTTPQRYTFGKDVAEARYEVRARRINQRVATSIGADQVVWEGMRGFIAGEETDFGDVTLLAIKIRATNNLNTRTQEKINVVCTRKLPIRNSDGEFGDPVATRSIIWAFVDVFRSEYGGRVTDNNFYDWDALEELEALYAGREEYFDWTFRDPITVWDAAKAVARAGRAVPLLSGSLITMRRDGPLSVPVTLFTPDNIIKGSFQWDIKLWEPNDHDCISIEYTEPDTGYQQENIICTLPGGTSDRPEEVRLPGVQGRNHAYREGLFLLATRKYLRENITFETGLEGFIPSYGDLVAVSHDVPRWSQFGYILAVEELTSGMFLLRVSEPLTFGDSGGYQVLLRGSRGQLVGPYDAEEQSDPHLVVIDVTDSDIDFLLGGRNEPMLFVFGIIEQDVKTGKVVKIEPQGGERIKITLVNYVSTVHSFDEEEAPPLVEPEFPEDPGAPTISNLELQQLTGYTAIVASWTASPSAQYYIVEFSYDAGESWSPAGTSTIPSMTFDTSPGEIRVRVAAVADGQGPWIEGDVIVSPVMGLTEILPWEALEWAVYWWPDIDIDEFEVSVYDISDPENPVLLRTEIVDGELFGYNYADAVTDGGLVRDHRIAVDARVLNDDTGDIETYGLPATLDLHNDVPTPPDNVAYSFQEVSSDGLTFIYEITWDNPTEGDLITVRVYYSLTEGFDPATASYIGFTAGAPSYLNVPEFIQFFFPLLTGNIHPDVFFRVGLFDVWGNEISTNLSEEVAIQPAWILAGGVWNDAGRWREEGLWID